MWKKDGEVREKAAQMRVATICHQMISPGLENGGGQAFVRRVV